MEENNNQIKVKLTTIIVLILVVAIIIVGIIFVILNKNNENKSSKTEKTNYADNVTISSDEICIATIYYDYEMGIDASRGYNVFIYKDSNDYKYEIKYGTITIAGPTEMKTKGYGRFSSPKDIEDLNNSFEKEKGKYEKFSIKYRILNEENSFKYCDLDEFKNYLFE